MAIKIYEQFAPFANPADGDYPYGSIKNDSIPGAEDGTPLDADWANDYAGFDAELFAQAGIVPSGQPDKLGASQRVDALKIMFNRKYDSVAALTTVPTANLTFGDMCEVSSYHQASVVENTFRMSGGGTFVWTDMPKSAHDGGIYIDPDRTYPDAWVSGKELDVYDWFWGTSNAGNGVWVRINNLDTSVGEYGARGNFDGTNGCDDTFAFNAATRAHSPYNAVNFSNNSKLKKVINVESTDSAYLIEGACYVRKGQELRGLGLGGARIYIRAPIVKPRAYDVFRLGVGLITNPHPSNTVLAAAGGTSFITLNGEIRNGEQYTWLTRGHYFKIAGNWYTVRNVTYTAGNTVIEIFGTLGATIAAGTAIEQAELSDSGGLPPSISNLCTEGGHVDGYVINGRFAAGMTINTLFITSANFGIDGSGGDVNLHTVTFDNGGVGLRLNGSRNSIIGCHFFWNNIGILCSGIFSKSYDYVMSGCTFAFNKFQDIMVDLGLDGRLLKFNISNCNFLENAQEPTKTGMIHFLSGTADVTISSTVFSNMKKWAINQSAGSVVNLKSKGNTYSGLKSNVDYIQSTTASAANIQDGQFEFSGDTFENLQLDLIKFTGGSLATSIVVKNEKVIDCTSGAALINFVENPIFLRVNIHGNDRINGNNPIIGGSIDVNNAHKVTLKDNPSFTVYSESGGRKIAKITKVIGDSGNLSVKANPAPGSSAHYIRSDVYEYITGTVFDTTVQDKIAAQLSGLSLGGSLPSDLSLTIGFDAAGVKSRAFSTNKIFDLFVTVPNTYSGLVAS